MNFHGILFSCFRLLNKAYKSETTQDDGRLFLLTEKNGISQQICNSVTKLRDSCRFLLCLSSVFVARKSWNIYADLFKCNVVYYCCLKSYIHNMHK